MAGEQLKPVASVLLVLNFCMYVIVLSIGGWSINKAIDHGFVIGTNHVLLFLVKLFRLSLFGRKRFSPKK